MNTFQMTAAVVLVAATLAGGCSTDGGTTPLGVPGVSSLPELPKLPDLPALSTFKIQGPVVGTPTEVYTRVARGVLTCWFGASGPLKGAYIYHAEADPPSKGGASVIDVHIKDLTVSKDPRALRAFRVAIGPGPDKTKLETENFKLPEDLATHLSSDVNRWAADEEGCGGSPIATGWTADTATPVADKKTKR